MKEDEPGMRKSINTVHSLIEEHISKGISSERIIIGGFSQGGAIALLVLCKSTAEASYIVTQSYRLEFHVNTD